MPGNHAPRNNPRYSRPIQANRLVFKTKYPIKPEGDHHAVQDDHPRTPATTTADARTATEGRKLLPTMELYAQRTEDQPRSLEGNPLGARPGSDQSQIASEAMEMALKELEDRLPTVFPRRQGTAFTRRSNGLHPQSHVARVKASRRQPTLFDFSSDNPPSAEPESLEPTQTPPPAEPPGPPTKPNPTTTNHTSENPAATPAIASGEKTKARDIIAAIRTLQTIEQEQRLATLEEKQTLARFAGFGPVALSIFPDPVTGSYKDAGWQAVGEELKSLLSPAEYDSAKRTTFNAFYTSPTVIASIHEAITRIGRAQQRHDPGAGLRHRQFHEPGKPWTSLYRRRAGFHLRAYRPSAPSRPGHPHREFQRHEAARGPH